MIAGFWLKFSFSDTLVLWTHENSMGSKKVWIFWEIAVKGFTFILLQDEGCCTSAGVVAWISGHVFRTPVKWSCSIASRHLVNLFSISFTITGLNFLQVSLLLLVLSYPNSLLNLNKTNKSVRFVIFVCIIAVMHHKECHWSERLHSWGFVSRFSPPLRFLSTWLVGWNFLKTTLSKVTNCLKQSPTCLQLYNYCKLLRLQLCSFQV